MKHFVRWVLLTMMLVGVFPVVAQDSGSVYTDPQGKFSAPIPPDWKNESTDTFGHFANPDGTVDIYIVGVENSDLNAGTAAALLLIDPTWKNLTAAGAPQQAPLPNGTWTQTIYVLPDESLLVVLAQAKDGWTFVVALRGQTAALQGANAVFLHVLTEVTFTADDTPPPYAKPDTFDESDVTVGSGEWALPGTLTMPKGTGPFPALVLVHGSGPGNRDEGYGPNKPFRDLAWGLASQGIAVLRYDKRTLVYGAKMVKLLDTLTVKEEFIDDALAAVTLLRNTPGIDPKRIFVLGHSEGGMVLPRIGAADKDIAGLIVMAGNTRPFEDLFVAQVKYLAAVDGTVTDQEQAQIDAAEKQVEAIKALKPGAKDVILGGGAAYWLDLRNYDPVKVAQTLTQPMLILQGERDYQVTFKEDFQGWKQGLAGRKDVTFKSYPALNHLFLAGEGQSTPEEYSHPGHIPEAVISDIATWIEAH